MSTMSIYILLLDGMEMRPSVTYHLPKSFGRPLAAAPRGRRTQTLGRARGRRLAG